MDDVVARLRAMVEERRRKGEYPDGLEHDLDQHFRRIVAYRASPAGGELDARLAELDVRAAFGADQIAAGSRAPGGAAVHRLVARLVARQTDGILAQLRDFADGVRPVLRSLAGAVQSPDSHVHTDVVGQLDAVLERLAGYERGPIESPATVADLRRRVEELESWTPRHFRPWFDSSSYVDTFQGTREELLVRSRELLGHLEACSPVLDVGCGRGELLELLGEAGVTARGVDPDHELIELARARNLDADVGDGLSALAAAADGELGAIVAVEALHRFSPNEVLRFVALAADKLRAGGKLLVVGPTP
ncbi:MAG: class I SAM-dependent methyltransferase, partial [Acidimicrobiales bacterium]